MKKQIFLFTVLILLFLISPVTALKYTDDFQGASINTSWWNFSSIAPATVNQTEGNLFCDADGGGACFVGQSITLASEYSLNYSFRLENFSGSERGIYFWLWNTTPNVTMDVNETAKFMLHINQSSPNMIEFLMFNSSGEKNWWNFTSNEWETTQTETLPWPGAYSWSGVIVFKKNYTDYKIEIYNFSNKVLGGEAWVDIDRVRSGPEYWTFGNMNNTPLGQEYRYSYSTFIDNFTYADNETHFLYNCTAGDANEAIRLALYQEENPDDQYNGSVDVTFEVNGTNQSFEFRNHQNYSVCLSILNLSSINMTAEYYADGMSKRGYYLLNESINRSVSVFDLFMLNSTLSSGVTFHLRDEYLNDVEDGIIKIMRYYPGKGLYKTVAMARTDYDGKDYTYVYMYDVWYKFLAEPPGESTQEFEPTKIASDEVTLTLSPAPLAEWFHLRDVSYSCSFNESTSTLRCTISDPDGNMVKSCFDVTYQDVLIKQPYYYACDSSTGTTYAIVLNNTNTTTYAYTLYAELGNPNLVVTAGFVDLVTLVATYGATGVFMSFLVLLTLGFVGAWNPVVGITLSTVAIIFSSVLGILPITYSALVGLIFVSAILVYRVKT